MQRENKSIVLENKYDTFSSYMNRELYRKYGYYATATVNFTTINNKGHYQTHATKGPGLAFVMVNYFHRMFEEQIKDNKRSLEVATPFIVVELSGGNGDLANNILNYLKKLSKNKVKHYHKLYEVIQYTTYEISPALAKIQLDKNNQFINEGKYNIKNVSAAEISELSIDVCFSNEFWDALPFDDIKKDSQGNIFIKICVAYTNQKTFTKLTGELLPITDNLSELRELIGSTNIPDGSIIDLPALEKKYQQCNNRNEWLDFLSQINWRTIWVPLSCYPTIEMVFNTIHTYMDELDPGIEHHLSSDLITIAKKLSVINPYYSMHFDYAGAAKGGSRFPVRYYPSNGNKNNIFNFQVNVDITTEVDFRLLAFLLSSNKLSDCIYNYNALACVILDDLKEPFLILHKDKSITLDDIEKFSITKANFKFLSHSSRINLKKLSNDIFLDVQTQEDFPGQALNPLNGGIPLDRRYKPDPDRLGCLLNPQADLNRVKPFSDLLLYDLRLEVYPENYYAFHYGRLTFNFRTSSGKVNTAEDVIMLDGTAVYELISKKPEMTARLFKTAEQVIEFAKRGDSAVYQLISKKPELIAPLFTTAVQAIELAKRNKAAAFELITKKLELIAPLFITAEQVIELARCSSQAAFELITKKLEVIAPLFITIDQIMELANCNSRSAFELITKKLEVIAPLFKTAEQVIELARCSSPAASELISKKLEVIAPLFKTAEQVIEFAKRGDSAVYELISKKPELIAPLFITAEQVIELDGCSSQAAAELISKKLEVIAPLFITIDQIMEFAKRGDSAVYELISKKPELIAPLFTTAVQVIELAKRNKAAAFELITKKLELIAPLFITAEQVIELARCSSQAASELISKKLELIAPLFITIDQIMELANCNSRSAFELITKKLEVIAPLFKTAEQVIELARCSSPAASELISKKPELIAPLFKTAEQVIELDGCSSQAASELISKKPELITQLFITETQVNKLRSASKSAASEIISQKNERSIKFQK